MIDKTNFDKTNAWPFVEAKKLLRERKSNIEKKNKIVLQTGYGPSGLPHIGTFGEVARTTMIVNALDHLTDIPKEIITFSDDMDGLRKVPENVPNQEKLKNNITSKERVNLIILPFLKIIVVKYVVGHSTLIFFPFFGPIPIVLKLAPLIKLAALTSLAGPSKFTKAVR